MKFCIDCKHRRTGFVANTNYCAYGTTVKVNLVTGKGERRWRACLVERSVGGLCGEEGRNYEERKPWWRIWR